MSGFVILLQSDVDALLEDWADIDFDPFWKPMAYVVRCRNQGAPFAEKECGYAHEGPCTLEVGGRLIHAELPNGEMAWVHQNGENQ